MISTKSRRFQLTVPFLLSEFIFEMETVKTEPTEEWLRRVMILRNHYVLRCPDELLLDFETAVNGYLIGKINGWNGNLKDISCLPVNKFQNEKECRVMQYCDALANKELKS